MKNNIFSVFQSTTFIEKFFGTVLFSISYGSEPKFVFNKTHIFISCFQISGIITALIYFWEPVVQIHNVYHLNIHSLSNFFLKLCYMFTLPNVAMFGLVYRDYLIEVWNFFHKFCLELEKIQKFVDYKQMKYFYYKSTISMYIIFLLYFSFDLIFCLVSGNKISIPLFFALCSLSYITLDSQIIMLLFILYKLTSHLNFILIQKADFKYIKIFIDNTMKKHFELYATGKIIRKLCNFLILRIFVTIFGTSYVALLIFPCNFEVFADCILIIDCVFWCVSNMYGLVLLIFYCECVKKEV